MMYMSVKWENITNSNNVLIGMNNIDTNSKMLSD